MRGVLRLGSIESAAGARLPPILSAFHARHPDVTIELQTGTTRAMLRQLERHEVEAAFVSEPFEQGSLSSVPAFDEELVLITASGAGAEPERARTVVAFPHGCSYRQRLFAWLAEAGRSPDRILEMSSYHTIVACVAAGTGAAIVPAAVLDHAVLATAVARHPLPDGLRLSRTHLVWSGQASPALRSLMALLERDESEWPASSVDDDDDARQEGDLPTTTGTGRA